MANDKEFGKALNDMIKPYVGVTPAELDAKNEKIKYLKKTLRQAAKSKQNIELNGWNALYGNSGTEPQNEENLNKLVYPTPRRKTVDHSQVNFRSHPKINKKSMKYERGGASLTKS